MIHNYQINANLLTLRMKIYKLSSLMLEARIYEDLYLAAADQLTKGKKAGQPTSGIKAVRIEVQRRSKEYLGALFDSIAPSVGGVAADMNYYIVGGLDYAAQRQFIQAWTAILAAVTLDHIEQTKVTPWTTAAFLDDFNEAAHRGTTISRINIEHLINAGKALGQAVNPNIPGEIFVSDKITTVLIRRSLGLDVEVKGEVWTPADFFSDYMRMSRVYPVMALLSLCERFITEEFLIAGQRFGAVASRLEQSFG